MNKLTKISGVAAALGLALTACGGDDGGSVQGQVADMMIEAMEAEDVEGVNIDEDCVRDAAGELSDSDAQAILDAGPEGDPEVSADAEAAGAALINCIEFDFDLDE